MIGLELVESSAHLFFFFWFARLSWLGLFVAMMVAGWCLVTLIGGLLRLALFSYSLAVDLGIFF